MGRVSAFKEPELLSGAHDVTGFNSGKPDLDIFLNQLALSGQREGFARTFVVADAGAAVVGYYALCGGTIGRDDAPRRIGGHGAPKEVPVVLLARLAVDRRLQGRGLGTMLLHHAFKSALTAAATVAFRAMMVHALDEEAAEFYSKFGFRPARRAENTLLMSIGDVAHIIKHVPRPGQ
jgi:GNAT superfamily N-acetyltransferase